MCSPPKPPAQQPITAPVQEQDAATKALITKRKSRIDSMTGYQGTILSGLAGTVGKTVLGD